MGKINQILKRQLFAIILAVSPLVVNATIFETAADGGCNNGVEPGCTANDGSISDIRAIDIIDGCVSIDDTMTLSMQVDIAASTSKTAYDLGIYFATDGNSFKDDTNGNTVTTCVHEALFAVGTPVDLTSGTGPFRDESDPGYNNQCGDITSADPITTRTLVQGDISDNSTTPQLITFECRDADTDGFADVGWYATYRVGAKRDCTSIADAVQSKLSGSKCAVGDYNSDAGIPDITPTISCSPSILKAGETTTCTVDYSNSSAAGVGPGDYLEWHLDYNETYGTVGNITITSDGGSTPDSATDTGGGYINWIVDENTSNAGIPEKANIDPGQSGQLTFEYTVDSNYDGTVQDIDFVMTAYFNKTGTAVEEPLLTNTATVTLPVTVNYAYPRKNGNKLDIDFSTASETANLGFNIYTIQGKKWTKLNKEIIPGSLDSFEPRDYHASVEIPDGMGIKKIGIAGIDIKGKEDRHGPFKVGKKSGSKSKAVKVDWEKVNKQVKADRKARKAAKKVARKATKQTLKDQSITLNVSENTVYRVTHEDLVAVGIDLRGQKAKNISISFRGEGVARHIEGLNKRKKWTKDSFIEFMGTKPNTTDALYIDANHYQLSLNKKLVVDSDAIKPMTQKEIVIEKNNGYGYTTPADDPFFEAYFFTLNADKSAEYTSTFDMPMIPEQGKVGIHIDTAVITQGMHKMGVYLNGTQIANVSAEDRSAWPINAEIDNGLLQAAGNKLKFVLEGENDGFDLVVYDKMIVTFDDGKEVASQTPKIELNEKITKKSVKPQRGINYVIITHSLFMGDTLDRYVKQREGEGWKIKVVNVEDIYAAYDNGMETPVAIKAYLKDAIKRGVTHVQLVGAASYDYHDYLGLGSVSFIPSAYAMTSGYIRYTPSDTAYVSDDKGLPMAAIGRWPVRSLEDFENVINKTLTWKSSGQSNQKTALLIADQEDRGYSFAKQLDKMTDIMSENGWDNIEHVYLDNEIKNANGDIAAAAVTARQKVTQFFSEGPSVLAYNGHGSALGWSSQHLLDAKDIVNIANSGQTTITLPFACQSTYADSPYTNTMAHQLLAAGENGAVAVYGSATMSTYGDNGVATGKVVKGLMMGHTLGESIKEAKRSLGESYRDVIRSGNLIGDVTLELK